MIILKPIIGALVAAIAITCIFFIVTALVTAVFMLLSYVFSPTTLLVFGLSSFVIFGLIFAFLLVEFKG